MEKFFKSSLFLLFIMFLFSINVEATENISLNDNSYTKSMADLQMAKRRLWIDHVAWTRSFIISDIASLEDKDYVLERLLRNQDDIGNSIKPYYGEEAGNKLSSLLREHILIAGKVVDAAKSGSKSDFEKYNKSWYKNADDIADFLSSINPNYSNKTLKDMLHRHLQLLTDAVTARLNKDWKADIRAYDQGEDHIIRLADVLADGIIKQFPEKFKQ
ncbi:MAG: glycosyltransferase [Clostridium sp.]